LDKYTLWALNHVAVANISQFGGRFRKEPIYVGNHIPPHFREVPELMDRFISFLHENWYLLSPTQLAAYGLWRLNWVHPFIEGNGRTARATCYYLLCVRSGVLLPGRKIVPERIRENRADYVAALRAADQAWNAGNLDISQMETYLARYWRRSFGTRTDNAYFSLTPGASPFVNSTPADSRAFRMSAR
jgi:Fic family protein